MEWQQPLAFGGLLLRYGVSDSLRWELGDASSGAFTEFTQSGQSVGLYPISVTLDWSGPAEPDHAPEVRFVSDSSDAGQLVDVSEGWEASLRLDPQESSAHASCRPLTTTPLQRRALIHGFCRIVSAMAAPRAGGVLIHGCAMVSPDRSRALLFVGASGDGKTTMSRRLAGWHLLADDTVWVGFGADGRFSVAGTPFAGKERLPRDGSPHRLVGLCILKPHSPVLSWIPLGAADAFAALIGRLMWFSADPQATAPAIEVLRRLVQSVPAGILASNLHHEMQVMAQGLVIGPEGEQ